MKWLLVKHIDADPDHLFWVNVSGEQVTHRLQRFNACPVDIVDFQIFRIGHHDVDRHVVEHGGQRFIVQCPVGRHDCQFCGLGLGRGLAKIEHGMRPLI